MNDKTKKKERGFFGKLFKKEKTEEIIIEHDPTIIHFSEQDEHGLVVGSGEAIFGAYKRENDEPTFKTGLTSDESYDDKQNNQISSGQATKVGQTAPEKIKPTIKNSSGNDIAHIHGKDDIATNNNQNNFLRIINGATDINIDLTSHPEKVTIVQEKGEITDIPLSISTENKLNIYTDEDLTITISSDTAGKINIITKENS